MSDVATLALLSTAVATALLHSLIPDHWLPFVLIGRARGWSPSTVMLVAGLAASIHTALSVLLGLLALGLGLTAVEIIGHRLEQAGAALLLALGLAYAVWAWAKGGHFHPGGMLVHRARDGGACDGREGPGHPAHLHYHADQALIGREGLGGVAVALIVGLNPCVLILPVLLASVPHGAGTLALVIVAYSVPTLVLMVGLSVLGVCWRLPLRLPGVARYAEAASGLLIALLGALFLFLDR